MVHLTIAGWTPPFADADTVSVALEPGIVVAELRETATCCPKI